MSQLSAADLKSILICQQDYRLFDSIHPVNSNNISKLKLVQQMKLRARASETHCPAIGALPDAFNNAGIHSG